MDNIDGIQSVQDTNEPIIMFLNGITSSTGPMDIHHYIKITFTRPRYSTNTIMGNVEHTSTARDANGFPNRAYKSLASITYSSTSVTAGVLSSRLVFYNDASGGAVANQGYCKIMRKPRAESGGEFQSIGSTGPTGPTPAINIVSLAAHSTPLATGYGVSPSSGLINVTLNGVSKSLIPFQNILVNTNNLFTINANNTFFTLPTTGTYRVNFNGISNGAPYTVGLTGLDIILCTGSPPTTAICLTRAYGGGTNFDIVTGSQIFSATAGQSIAFAGAAGNLWAGNASNSWPSGPDILPQMNIELIGGNGPTGPAGSIMSVSSSDASITTTTTSGAVNLSIPALLRPAVVFVSYSTWATDVNQTLPVMDFQNYDYEMNMHILNIPSGQWIYYLWNGATTASHYGDLIYTPTTSAGNVDTLKVDTAVGNDSNPYTLYSGNTEVSTVNRNIYVRYRFRGLSANRFMMSIEGRYQLSWFDENLRVMPQYAVFKMNTTYITTGNNANWAPQSLKTSGIGTSTVRMTWLRISKTS